MIYLACPYADPDPSVRAFRFNAATEVAATLINEGHMVFSPITHSYPIVFIHNVQASHEYWMNFDLSILAICNWMLVLNIPGWQESKGVSLERKFCEDKRIQMNLVTQLNGNLSIGGSL